jgi:hypothetical protein
MDLPTLFFLYRGVGSHDSGCDIRFFMAVGGRLLFDGARGPVEDTFATSPDWVACSMSQIAGGSPGDWSSSSMRMAMPSRKLYGQVVKRINEPCLLPTRLKDLIVSMVKEKIDPRLCLRLLPAIASFVTTPRPQKEIRRLKSRPLNKWELPTNGMKQAEFGGAGTWVAQRGARKGQGTSCKCHGGKGQA